MVGLQFWFATSILLLLPRGREQIETELDRALDEQLEIRRAVREAEGEVDDAEEQYGDTSEEYFEKTDKLEALNHRDNDLEDRIEELEAELSTNQDAPETRDIDADDES